MIADLGPDVAASSYATPRIGSADRMIFDASTTNAVPRTHWVTDGTPEGTRPTFTDNMTSPVRFRDLVYFGKGQELWATDGTPESTRRIATLDRDIVAVTAIGDFLYVTTSISLWASDGTTGGTKRIGNEGVRPIPFAGRAIVAMDGTFSEINGNDPLRPIVSVPGGTSDIAVAGGHFFSFTFSNPTTMWADDGTADGMRQVATFSGFYTPSILGAAEDRLVFTIDDGIHGRELWASDGTTAGTHLIADIRPGPLASQIGRRAVLDRRIVFTADDGTNGRALWITDGTAAGTTRISALNETITDDLSTDLAGVKGVAFFVADDGVHGRELWQSDGTPEGTKLVADINPGPSSSYVNTFEATDNTLFFGATANDTGAELWALPLPWRTIAMFDARVRSDAATAAMTIALDRATTETIGATWTTSAGDSGVVTFAPGETRKTIAFPIASDATARFNRTIVVRLSDLRGAIPTRSYATLIVEAVGASANLSVSVDNSTPLFGFKVTNAGPSAVTGATLHILSSGTPASIARPLPTIQPGASDTTTVSLPGTYGATVTSSTPDPDLSDNTVTLQLATTGNLRMALWPAALTVGSQATIAFAGSPGTTLQVTSSNPAVLALPDTVTLPATINVTALAAGTTTITFGGVLSLVATVEPAGTRYRWPANLTFSIDASDRTYGTPQHFVARIPAIAFDSGAHPTGVVTFRDGNSVIATAAVDRNGIGEKFLDLLPGTHSLTASYPGDDNFLPDSATAPPLTIFAPYAPTFIGMVRPLTDTTAEITITVVAPHTAIPTGTITMRRFDQVLAKDVPVIDGKAVAVTSKQLFITVDYSGDALYPATIQSINLVPARHRAAP